MPTRFMRLRLHRIALAGAVLVGAFRPRGDSESASPMAAFARAALDSCNASTWSGTGRPGSGPTKPRPTGGLGATLHDFPGFSLFVPRGARITASDSAPNVFGVGWPDCDRCRFAVSISTDSGITVDQRIARMVASQARIDSINKDPHTEIHEFDEIDGPPVLFLNPSGRGYLIDNDCGDCASLTLMYGEPGHLAQVSIGIDDDVPAGGRHLCEMTAIGKTLAWRR